MLPHLNVSSEEIQRLKNNFNTSPSHLDLLIDLWRTLRWYYAVDKWTEYRFPQSMIKAFRENFHFHSVEIVYLLVIAVILTGIRYGFERYLCKPLIRCADSAKDDKKKFPESMWKCCFYTCTWLYCLYLVQYRYDYFYQPYLIWDDWASGMPVPLDIKLLYFIECGFYIHSIYATLYMDSKRKDFHIMLLHHILTVALIFISYATRYHKVGLLVLFVHDVTDICLEVTKLCRYLTNRQDGSQSSVFQFLSHVGFLLFTLCWFLFRLYWFPLKVLYTTGVVSVYRTLEKGLCFYGLFNILLWILLGLNLYWLFFILQILLQVLLGRSSNVGDVRDDDLKKTKKH